MSILKKDLSIFDRDSFTLKELCILLSKIKDLNYSSQIHDIIMCYMNFTSGNSNYRTFLNNTRNNKGYLYIDKINNKTLVFRELLQMLDFEFTKLVIRIKTECKNYDILISWNDFEEKTKNISKLEFKEFIEKNIVK